MVFAVFLQHREDGPEVSSFKRLFHKKEDANTYIEEQTKEFQRATILSRISTNCFQKAHSEFLEDYPADHCRSLKPVYIQALQKDKEYNISYQAKKAEWQRDVVEPHKRALEAWYEKVLNRQEELKKQIDIDNLNLDEVVLYDYDLKYYIKELEIY